MSGKKVAIVTGANKGIGYEIVKGLCQKFDGDVLLTSRDVERGTNAVKSLNEQGFHPKYHQLDVTDIDSIWKLHDFVEKEYLGIDILINNAAIAFPNITDTPFSIQAKETLKINYFALKDVCQYLFPLLRAHARVVNLSSSAGHLTRIPSKELRKTLSSPDLKQQELDELMTKFVTLAQTGQHTSAGWGSSAYVVSKVGVSALTRIQQKRFVEDDTVPDIVINSVHPGYVDTDMTSHQGPLTPEQGAVGPLYAALLPENIAEPKGQFIWCDKQTVDWVNGPLP